MPEPQDGGGENYENEENDSDAASSPESAAEEEEEEEDDDDDDDDEEFLPRGRSKRQRTSPLKGAKRIPHAVSAKTSKTGQLERIKRQYLRHENRVNPVSRDQLVKEYPLLPAEYPLVFHALLPNMTVNPELVPMIGSISSQFTVPEKCEVLKEMFGRARRVVAQLDAFTARAGPKNASPSRWKKLSTKTHTTLRDVRRKIVERCENYKYTRRNLLNQ
jgi:hypothetical protein